MIKSFRVFPLLISLLLTATLPSCVYDNLDDAIDNSNPSKSGKLSLYLQIKTLDGLTSRADNDGFLDDGAEGEQAIGQNGNFIIFFDGAKKYHSAVLLDLAGTNTSEPEVVESTYTATIYPGDFDQDPYDKLPRYCLLVLNGGHLFDTFDGLANTVTDTDIFNEILSSDNPLSIGYDEDGRFIMTNSAYFDEDGQDMTLVEITKDMIFDPSDPSRITLFPDESKGLGTAYPAPKLKVYMERMLSKISLDVDGIEPGEDGYYYYTPKAQQFVIFDEIDKYGSPTYSACDWRIQVTGWNMNGLEKRSHLFKNVSASTPYNAWSDWKAPERYRTYWAIDPDYVGTYPLQYRKSLDVLGIKYYEDFEKRSSNLLRNYSYDDLQLDMAQFGQAIYRPENTYDVTQLKSSLDDRTDLLAGTHLILGARIQLKGENDKYEAQDLYRDRDGFFYRTEKDCVRALILSLASTLSSQEQMRYTFYNWSEDPSQNAIHGTVFYAATKGEHKFYVDGVEVTQDLIDKWPDGHVMCDAQIKGGDGYRVLWPDNATLSIKGPNGAPLMVTDMNGKTRQATQDDVRSIIHEWVGPVAHFNEGRMYYTAPAVIKHASGQLKDDVCGVVRNNWYQYHLTDVKKLGYPVDKLDQPIVPEEDANKDQINVLIEILDWHHFDTSVDVLRPTY